MVSREKPNFKPQAVNKFYFLEYFYVLLRSVEQYKHLDDIFNTFKNLKQQYQLGESKYKKKQRNLEDLTSNQIARFKYTLNQVIEESLSYKIIQKQALNSDMYVITDLGRDLLKLYSDDMPDEFYYKLLIFMEKKFNAFRDLIELCYNFNKTKGGLLIFPIYSPLKLDFDRKELKTISDLKHYIKRLSEKIDNDVKRFLDIEIDVAKNNDILVLNLIKADLLSGYDHDEFNPQKYNIITKRIRDYWLNFFLQNIYKYPHSFSTFEIWIYRAKQIGIFNATEFYPGFNGRIVYPTSIIGSSTRSKHFTRLFEYNDGSNLFIHYPNYSEDTQEEFIASLNDAYQDVRDVNKNYFVNLADVREIVCYKMKIATYIFDRFLEKVYKQNLQGDLKIKISLEADKLPQETTAMYLKREPVKVDGKLRNIIAIDITRR